MDDGSSVTFGRSPNGIVAVTTTFQFTSKAEWVGLWGYTLFSGSSQSISGASVITLNKGWCEVIQYYSKGV